MKKILLIIELVLLPVLLSAAEPEIYGNYVITPDSVKIYFESQGEGIPIFMIAGGPGGNPNFMKTTHKLWLNQARLIYIHNRGRGKSEALDSVPGAYSVQNDILDLEAVRNALELDKIIVYGHSYGGMIALYYAATYPENTLAVMTTGTLDGDKNWQKHNIDAVKYFLQRHYPQEWKKIVEIHENGVLTSEDAYETVWPQVTEMYYYNPDRSAEMSAIYKSGGDSSTVGFNYNVYVGIVGDDPEWVVGGSMKGFELSVYTPNINCPALIMGGRYDRICPPAVQQEIAAAIPDAEVHIFDKSGHRPFFEEPVEFFEVTGQFLNKLIQIEE